MAVLSIRKAALADASPIAGLHVRSWQAGYRGLLADELLDGLSVEAREDDWRGWLGNEDDGASFVLVAERDRAIVGFCSVATPSRDTDAEERTRQITGLYVDPCAWRSGVGSGLLSTALDVLHGAAWEAVTLWAIGDNDRAHRFYRHFEFVPDGARKRADDGPILVRLRRSLVSSVQRHTGALPL